MWVQEMGVEKETHRRGAYKGNIYVGKEGSEKRREFIFTLESQVHQSSGLAGVPMVTGSSGNNGFSTVITYLAVCRTGDSISITSNTSAAVVVAFKA